MLAGLLSAVTKWAIPSPTRDNLAYNQRSWPQYAIAVERSGGFPVEIPIDATPTAIANLINVINPEVVVIGGGLMDALDIERGDATNDQAPGWAANGVMRSIL